MLLVDKDDNLQKQALFTPWSLVHFTSGWIGYIILKTLRPDCDNIRLAIIWLLIHTVYEMKDYTNTYVMNISKANTFINSVGDTISTMAGFGFGVLIKRYDPQTFFASIFVLIVTMMCMQKYGLG